MSLTKSKEIWNSVVNILQSKMQSGEDLEYFANLYQGVRDDIPKFPVIVLEPISEKEENITIGQGYRKKITLTIGISIITEVYNIDTQITGETEKQKGEYKGILDMSRDVKNVLSVDPTLGETCKLAYFGETIYGFENFPYRYCNIMLNCEYYVFKDSR